MEVRGTIPTPKSIILTRILSISDTNGVVITSLKGVAITPSSLPESVSVVRTGVCSMYLEITASGLFNSSSMFDGFKSVFDCQLLALISYFRTERLACVYDAAFSVQII
jgi:uncharacterized membrane protein